jgi:hypothetical protein
MRLLWLEIIEILRGAGVTVYGVIALTRSAWAEPLSAFAED